jgi:ribosome biogenesis GTPase / thiamine phosphate phosphatase
MEKLQSGLVIEFYSNSCLVRTDSEDIKCLAIKNIVVGDIVYLELIQDSKEVRGIIISKEPRTSFLQKREGIKSKAVAANISHVGILVTPEPTTSTEFIDKWLVTTISSNITPFIINNKTDLDQSSNYKNKLQVYKNLGIKIINLSAKNSINTEELKEYLKAKCVVFVGNSGAGKSTLTTKLTGKNIKTNMLSNNQGVHTTSISTLYEIDNQTKIIDSPGVRDLPISGLSNDEIIEGFTEIYLCSKNCKFSDCNHIANEGCEVISKLLDGEINENRYNNFIKFRDGEDNG